MHDSQSVSWWAILVPWLFALAIILAMPLIVFRKRRWSDLKPLARAAKLPPEHMPARLETVRDMKPGQSGYVSASNVVSSKRGRVYVRWDATLQEPPERPDGQFAPLLIRRLKRGFSLRVRPGDQFRESPLPWGSYAPVIGIVQLITDDRSIETRNQK